MRVCISLVCGATPSAGLGTVPTRAHGPHSDSIGIHEDKHTGDLGR